MSFDKECCDDCNSHYVIATRKLYFPKGYSDEYVMFNHTPTTEDLAALLRFVESNCWFTATLENARLECAAAKKSLENVNNSKNSK